MQIIPGQAGSGGAIHSIVSISRGKTGSDVLLRHLLLVDDEADGAEFAAILLRSHGLQVTVVHSADAALKVLDLTADIDAVLTDIVMPRMSGLQLADVIRDKYPTIKIIVMSGYASPDSLKKSKQSYLFASKPYRIDNIIALLNS